MESNFPPFFTKLMISYLTERNQCVKINSTLSSCESVSSGVPQGSVLGPLLFVAVMGTLKKLHKDTGLVKFIDDVTIIVPITRNASGRVVAEEDDNVRSWANKVGLTINERKSKCLVFKKSLSFIPITLPHVEFVNSHKILGIVWSSDLKWDKHFDSISRVFVSRLHCLRVLKNFLSKDDMLLIYSSLLRVLLEYCSPLFVTLSKRNSALLDRLQNRAHRIICGKDCKEGCFEDLSSRRFRQSNTLFRHSQASTHVLNTLLPPRSNRSSRFKIPLIKSMRRANSFIPCMVLNELGFT